VLNIKLEFQNLIQKLRKVSFLGKLFWVALTFCVFFSVEPIFHGVIFAAECRAMSGVKECQTLSKNGALLYRNLLMHAIISNF
jgi:hypothetical protein